LGADESEFGGMRRARLSLPDNSDAVDLFAAIQKQLGLKLEATKGLVEAFIID
jgi:uncharacterized protein (TIGR03435 family)